MEAITKEMLDEKGFEIFNFDQDWLVAFRNNKECSLVEIFWRDLNNENDGGVFKTLLHDEVEAIHKVIYREY